MSDVYAHWRAANAGGKTPGELDALALPTVGAAIPGENPQPGLWKVRLKKGAPPVLMQVWLADESGSPANEWRTGLKVSGILVINPERIVEMPPLELAERWLYVQPATKDEAAHWRKEGRWPADPPPLPPRTHNYPGDPFTALQVDVEDRLRQAQQWLTVHAPIADQLGCDTATNYNRELLSLIKRADTMHTAEKAPILEAGRAVDRKFDFRDAVRKLADALRNAAGSWMAAEERRKQEERDRQYREERAKAEAERARIEAERAEKLANDPVAALTDPEPSPPPMPPPPAPVRMQAGGGIGRKAGLKDDWDIEITDYKLAALLVIEDPEIAILVGKVIKRRVRAAKGKGDWPGVKIIPLRRVA